MCRLPERELGGLRHRPPRPRAPLPRQRPVAASLDHVFAPIDSGFAASDRTAGAPTVMTSPNQLYAVAVQGGKVYVTSVSASPEPPINFDANVFPVVYVGDLATGTEDRRTSASANLARLVDDQIPDDDDAASSCRRSSTSTSSAIPTWPTSCRAPPTWCSASTTIAPTASRSAPTRHEQIDVGTRHVPEPDRHRRRDRPRRRAYVNCWVTRRLGVIDLDAQTLTEPCSRSTLAATGPRREDDPARRALLLHRPRPLVGQTAKAGRRAARATPTA